jgi:hypothetical protein
MIAHQLPLKINRPSNLEKLSILYYLFAIRYELCVSITSITILTLPLAITSDSFPNRSLVAADEKDSKPNTGKYSWFRVSSFAIFCSVLRTTGKTQGAPSSVLYAKVHGIRK